MFRRGITSLALAGALTVAVGVTAVLADTTQNYDEYYATFGPGDGSVQVSATIGTSDLGPLNHLSMNAFSVEDVTCPDGSAGTIERSSNGESSSATINIDKLLRTARASGSVTGTEETLNSCTGSDDVANITRDVSMDLHATTGSSTASFRNVITYPDGTKETSTSKLETRFAAGSVQIGGTTYTAQPSEAQIAHVISTDVIKAPRH